MKKSRVLRRSIQTAISPVLENLEQRRLLSGSVSLQTLSGAGAVKDDAAGAQVAPDTSFGGSVGVIAWSDSGSAGVTGQDILARRYDSGGFSGNPFVVNSTTAGNQNEASVASGADGSFVVVWTDTNTANNVIRGQRYGADGAAAGSEFAVSTNGANVKDNPHVAMASSGAFVVSWDSAGQDGAGSGVIARQFAANGTASGAEFVVNTTTAGDQQNNAVGIGDSGAFVVAFQSPDATGDGIWMQRYNAAGAAQGVQSAVNTTTNDEQTHPDVAVVGSSGAYIVAWQSSSQDGSGEGIFLQRFTSSGATTGSETGVNTTTAGDQRNASIALTASGSFTIAWGDDSTTPDRFVARAYNASATAVTGENVIADDVNVNARPNTAAITDARFLSATELADNGGDTSATMFRSQLDLTTSSGGQTVIIAESLGGIVVTENGNPDSFPATEAIDFVGGAGPDSVTVNNGLPSTVSSIRIDTGGGNDTVVGSDLSERIDGAAGNDSITANDGNDTLYGSAGNDTIAGGDGNDRIDPGTGDDSVAGGNDNDTLTYQTRSSEDLTVRIDGLGESGATGEHDTIGNDFENAVGGDGNDLVIGNANNNILGGADGNDTLDAGLGEDTIFGDNGTDTVSYASHTQPVNVSLDGVNNDGMAGENDELHDLENITGGSSADHLTGDSGSNVLDGGAGDDVLDGGTGADTLIGGAGTNDTATYASRTNAVNISIDNVANDGENGENDSIDGTIENLTAGAGNDTLTGDEHYNTLDGGAGNDSLTGNGGNDRILGRDGNDSVDGGHGADAIYGLAGTDSLFGGPGRDKIFGGDDADRIKGGSGDDTITGDNGNDQLYGDTGADSMDGGSGNDNVTGGSGNDKVNGNAGDDKLYGESGSDTLNGGTGADRMDGGLSSDSAFKDDLDRLFSVEHIL